MTHQPLFSEAEQRAILDVARIALAACTEKKHVFFSVSPHVRGVDVYGYFDGWQRDSLKPQDFNFHAFLADTEDESLTQLAVLSHDLRQAVGAKQ